MIKMLNKLRFLHHGTPLTWCYDILVFMMNTVYERLMLYIVKGEDVVIKVREVVFKYANYWWNWCGLSFGVLLTVAAMSCNCSLRCIWVNMDWHFRRTRCFLKPGRMKKMRAQKFCRYRISDQPSKGECRETKQKGALKRGVLVEWMGEQWRNSLKGCIDKKCREKC